jgi:hypothetical protein
MSQIEKRFSVISEPVGCSLLIDEVTSCITGGEIYGSVQARLSVDEAMAMGGALIAAAEEARAKTMPPTRIAINAAIAAARVRAARKAVRNA